MKFLALLFVIGFVAAAGPTKEELEARAKTLEASLSEEAAKAILEGHRQIAEMIEKAELELKILSDALQKITDEKEIEAIEKALGELEKRVEEELKHADRGDHDRDDDRDRDHDRDDDRDHHGSLFKVVVAAFPTKEELETKAKELEKSLGEEAAKAQLEKNTKLVEFIEKEEFELKLIADILAVLTDEEEIRAVEIRLAELERRVEEQLKHADDHHDDRDHDRDDDRDHHNNDRHDGQW